jgi:PGF-pre-PGF domain-containing protein
MKMKNKFNKKIGLFLSLIVLAIAILPIVYSIPVPHGVSGHVYDLDGITSVKSNAFFSVEDSVSGEYIFGKTRNGKYSVSLNGNNGNLILVKVWNKYNYNQKNVSLNGVMRDVNLLLNMTYPPIPPNITSIPINNIFINEKYEYQLEVIDDNNDLLEYYLQKSPNLMDIDSVNGIIKWNTTNNDLGTYEIIVVVSDGMFNVSQSYTLSVNDYEITLPDSGGSSGGGGGGGNSQEDAKEKNLVNENIKNKDQFNDKLKILEDLQKLKEENEKLIEKAITKSGKEIKLNVKNLNQKPKQVKTLPKKVYKYLEIKTKDNYEDEINIDFKIEKKWLNENKASVEDLVLNRYVINEWHELSTQYIKEDESFVYYKSITPGFSFFAISLKSIVEIDDYLITGPKESYSISGTVFINSKKQIEPGSLIKIINLNSNETIIVNSSIGQNSGAYYTIINGKIGDEILINVDGLSLNKTITLQGDMRNVDLVLYKNIFSKVTGNVIGSFNGNLDLNGLFGNFIIVLLVISILFLLKINYKQKKTKTKKFNKNKKNVL